MPLFPTDEFDPSKPKAGADDAAPIPAAVAEDAHPAPDADGEQFSAPLADLSLPVLRQYVLTVKLARPYEDAEGPWTHLSFSAPGEFASLEELQEERAKLEGDDFITHSRIVEQPLGLLGTGFGTASRIIEDRPHRPRKPKEVAADQGPPVPATSALSESQDPTAAPAANAAE